MSTAPSDPNLPESATRPHESLAPVLVLRPSWWATFFAPYRFIFQPQRAAATMVAGPRSACWLALAVGIALIACIAVGVTLWSGMVTVQWGGASSGATYAVPTLQERTLSEVWEEWRQESALAACIRMTLYCGVPVVLSAAFMAWLQLPRVHRSGRVGDSWLRAFFGVVSGIGLLVVLVGVLGPVSALIDNYQDRRMSAWLSATLPGFLGFAIVLGEFLASVGLVFWVEHASLGARHPAPFGPRSPRCEQCGYDLTYVPASGRCSECGAGVQAMLVPRMRRPGSPWEDSPTASTWLEASLALLLRPSQFYAYLMVSTSDAPARRFAAWHYIVIFASATLWGALVTWRLWGSLSPLLPVAAIYTLSVPLCVLTAGWGVQRVLGAVVGSAWLVRGTLPDFCPAWKVLSYETVYLWVFVAYDGLLMTSLLFFGDWMSALLMSATGTAMYRGVPESLAILLGNGALCVLWLWRYRRAGAAVRWANF